MECTVRWMGNDGGMSFVAESGSGHAVVIDGAPEHGGRNLGMRPMEMVLAGTAAYEREDYAAAAAHWERLLKRLPPESEDAQSLAESIKKARAAAQKQGRKKSPAGKP
mgnify:CR=1 FL=1